MLTGGAFFVLLHHPGSSTDTRLQGTLLNHPSPTPTPTPPLAFAEARAAVSQFYKDLNARDYQAALNWVVTSQSLCSFAENYSRTLNSTIAFGNEQFQSDGSVKVPITIQATENIDEGEVMRVYSTYQIVKQVNNVWRIVGGGPLQKIGQTKLITPVATVTPSESQAQIVISQFYNDISNQDYRGAFSLLGTGLQGSNTYCQFFLSHVQILHDDVTFGDITALRSGLTRITVTISETKQTSSGPTTKTYQMTYVVGQENNSWKILDETSP